MGNCMDKLLIVFGGILFLAFVSFVLSWPVYMLWNGCLVDAVDGVNEVTWMQGWGLSFLFSILFKPNVSSK